MIIKTYDGDVKFCVKNRGWFLHSKNPENNLALLGLITNNGIKYDSDN